jgi:hypothetical protein
MMQETDYDIDVQGVSNSKTTGLHFIMNYGFPTRRCSVMNDPVGDGFIMTYGDTTDFHPNNNARDSARRTDFDWDQVQAGAKALLAWLHNGTPIQKPKRAQ